MQYQQDAVSSQFPYPDHSIDPSKKDEKWFLQYTKAAYNDFTNGIPKGVFSANGGEYEKNRLYGMGKQPITPYKKMQGVDEKSDTTWLKVDFTIRAIATRYRTKAISKLMKGQKGIVATPIDELAKAEMEGWYAQMTAKLAVRQQLLATNPEMADHPMIMPQTGEPMDMEELEMRVQMGEQFNRSKDAEQAIELGFYENNYTQCVKAIYEDLYDYGVAGIKSWLGDDNKAKFRRVEPNRVIVSDCKKADFSDAVHIGELIPVPLIELATKTDAAGNKLFTDDELTEFANSIIGKAYGNPNQLGGATALAKPYDKFHCKVLDLEFFTYNEEVYYSAKDKTGNADFRKADYNRGKKSDKYMRKRIQYVCKCKWIVGTDKVYDWGYCDDQPRSSDPKKKAYTCLSYRLIAYNFYEMRAQSIMEQVIPYADDHQNTILKIQNFKNRAVPSGWWIDLDALENAAYKKAGKDMEPMELLQMFFDTGTLVGRSHDAAGNPMGQNWKPVIPIENTVAAELAGFYQDLMNTIGQIEAIVGFNSATMGEANPKLLVPGFELASQSTDDALYPLAFAESQLKTALAEDVLCRMGQGVRKGDVTGYAPYGGALNKNTLSFIKVSPDIAIRQYGIMLEEKSTDQDKMWLMQNVQQDIANGFLDTGDAIFIISTHNVKSAMMIFGCKVRKAKEAAAQQRMQEIQQQQQGAIQSAQIAQQSAQALAQLESQTQLQKAQLDSQTLLQKEKMRLDAEYQIKLLEMGYKDKINQDLVQGKQTTQQIANQGKIVAHNIQHQQGVDEEHLAGQYNILKQQEANKKPQPKATK